MVEFDVRSTQPKHPVHDGLEITLHEEFKRTDVGVELRKIEIEVMSEIKLQPLLINGIALNVHE